MRAFSNALSLKCFVVAVILGCGCTGVPATKPPTDDFDSQKDRRPTPNIVGFRIFRGDAEVTHVGPDEQVRIVAVAEHAGGKQLTYRWRASFGAGEIQVGPRPEEIRWSTGKKGLKNAVQLKVLSDSGTEDTAYLDIGRPGGLFTGRILDENGNPIQGAVVSVSGRTAVSGPDGHYAIPASRDDGRRYVLSVEKPGYGYVSQILDGPKTGTLVKLPPGNSSQFDPRQNIVMQATLAGTTCNTGNTFSSRTNWATYPAEHTLRRSDGSGTPLTTVPPDINSARQIIESGLPCDAGFQVSIPANSLVDASGNPPGGPVTVSVSVVNTFNPTAMPGDYSVLTAEGGAYMETLGAGSITITRDGKPINLRKGATAEIAITPDPYQRKAGRLPAKIPLLLYDRKAGIWKVEGTARLDAKAAVYRATVTHFSEFNADYVKTNSSCIRFDAPTLPANFRLEVTIPSSTGSVAVLREYAVDNSPSTRHALINLPNNTNILLRPYVVDGSGAEVPLTSVVANSGAVKINPTVNAPTAPDYGECQGVATLVATQSAAGPTSGPTNVTVSYPNLWDAVLNWNRAVSASYIEVYRAPTSAVVFSLVDILPGNANTYAINAMDPCGSWLYRLTAVGPSGSLSSSAVFVTTEVMAFVTVTESEIGEPVMPGGTYEVTCQGRPGGKGIGLFDRNANGIVNVVPQYVGMPPGPAGNLYPRQLVLGGGGAHSNQAGGSFGALTGGGFNDFLAAFRFGAWVTAPSEQQYAAFYFKSTTSQVTGLFAGNLTTGMSDVIVSNTGPITWDLDGYPPGSSGEPGAWRGHVSGFLAFTDTFGVTYQAQVHIDLNAPIYWDQ